MRKLSEVFKENSGYKMFFLSLVTFGLSYGLYKGVIDNFLAEIVSMSSFDKGLSEFFREIPGSVRAVIIHDQDMDIFQRQG